MPGKRVWLSPNHGHARLAVSPSSDRSRGRCLGGRSTNQQRSGSAKSPQAIEPDSASSRCDLVENREAAWSGRGVIRGGDGQVGAWRTRGRACAAGLASQQVHCDQVKVDIHQRGERLAVVDDMIVQIFSFTVRGFKCVAYCLPYFTRGRLPLWFQISRHLPASKTSSDGGVHCCRFLHQAECMVRALRAADPSWPCWICFTLTCDIGGRAVTGS